MYHLPSSLLKRKLLFSIFSFLVITLISFTVFPTKENAGVTGGGGTGGGVSTGCSSGSNPHLECHSNVCITVSTCGSDPTGYCNGKVAGASCGPAPYCGDHICNNGESCSSCPGDCGACPVIRYFCSGHQCLSDNGNGTGTYTSPTCNNSCAGSTGGNPPPGVNPTGATYQCNTTTKSCGGIACTVDNKTCFSSLTSCTNACSSSSSSGNGTTGGGGCFAAGTKISMADGTQKNIEDVKTGEKVIGFNGTKTIIETINQTEIHLSNDLYSLHFDNGDILKVTSNHPLYTSQGWKTINPELEKEIEPTLLTTKLNIGDKLLTESGKYNVVVAIDYIPASITTYNLRSVTGTHTYFANGFAVHNGPSAVNHLPPPPMYTCSYNSQKNAYGCFAPDPGCNGKKTGDTSSTNGQICLPTQDSCNLACSLGANVQVNPFNNDPYAGTVGCGPAGQGGACWQNSCPTGTHPLDNNLSGGICGNPKSTLKGTYPNSGLCCAPDTNQPTACETNGNQCMDMATLDNTNPIGTCPSTGHAPLTGNGFQCRVGQVCCPPSNQNPGTGKNFCGSCAGNTCSIVGAYCLQATSTCGTDNSFAVYTCDKANDLWQFKYNQKGGGGCTCQDTGGNNNGTSSSLCTAINNANGGVTNINTCGSNTSINANPDTLYACDSNNNITSTSCNGAGCTECGVGYADVCGLSPLNCPTKSPAYQNFINNIKGNSNANTSGQANGSTTSGQGSNVLAITSVQPTISLNTGIKKSFNIFNLTNNTNQSIPWTVKPTQYSWIVVMDGQSQTSNTVSSGSTDSLYADVDATNITPGTYSPNFTLSYNGTSTTETFTVTVTNSTGNSGNTTYKCDPTGNGFTCPASDKNCDSNHHSYCSTDQICPPGATGSTPPCQLDPKLKSSISQVLQKNAPNAWICGSDTFDGFSGKTGGGTISVNGDSNTLYKYTNGTLLRQSCGTQTCSMCTDKTNDVCGATSQCSTVSSSLLASSVLSASTTNTSLTKPTQFPTILSFYPANLAENTKSNLLAKVLAAQVYAAKDTLTYDPKTGYFVNPNFNTNNIPPGNYKVFVHVDKYLDAQLQQGNGSDTFSPQIGSPLNPKVADIIPGDVAPAPHGDNIIDIQDYNAMVSCITGIACNNKSLYDLDNNGKVDSHDLDILISHFGESGASFGIPEFTCVTDPTCVKDSQKTIQLCPLKCTKIPQNRGF